MGYTVDYRRFECFYKQYHGPHGYELHSRCSNSPIAATLYSENLNLTEAHQNKKRKTYEQGARVFIVCRNHQQEEDTPHVLSSLVPRLWPFLRHKVVAVRLATLKTLSKLLTMTGVDHPQWWIMPLLSDALQLVFQNILLESHKVQKNSVTVYDDNRK